MGKHLDHISDSLLKEVNEDIHDLNQSVKEMSASVEALKTETGAVFQAHYENLQKLYIELAENLSSDIKEDIESQLETAKQSIDQQVGSILETKFKEFDKSIQEATATLKASKGARGAAKPPSKLLITLLVLLVVSISAASFVVGRHQEQTRFENLIEIIPYLDTSEIETAQ